MLTFDEDNFDEQIASGEGPILVDFWASWCAPCRAIVPSLEQLSEEFGARARVARVDVDENGDLVNRFGVRSVPTLVVFKGGRIVEQLVGAASKDEIRQLVERHLG